MIHLDEADGALLVKILKVFAPEGRKLVAFGSRVTGVRLKEASDLDLCIMGDTPLPERAISDLKGALSHSNLTVRVDVVDWADTAPEFQAIIKDNCEEIVFQEGACLKKFS